MSNPILFNKPLLRQRLSQLPKRKTRNAFLDEMMQEDILERLIFIEREFEKAALISPFLELKTALKQHAKIKNLICAAPTFHSQADIIAEEEFWPFAAQSLSLIISMHGLACMNDLPGALIQMRHSLKPDGLLLASFLGGDSLFELRDVLLEAESAVKGGAAMRIHPMVEVKEAGALLQRAGFALPVADVETYRVSYESLFHLLHDLRSMGLTNVLKDQLSNGFTKNILFKAAQIYQEKYGLEQGKIAATFQVIWLSGWSPHESQQQPLKPGSATHKMADFLKPSD